VSRLAAALVLAVALSGCASVRGWFGSSTSAPIAQPPGPTTPSVVASLGEALDKTDGKVAAAVTVARDNADTRPDIVKAEAAVALSLLPKPSQEELLIANARAKAADPAAYNAAQAEGRRTLASLEKQWATLEADQKAAKAASDKKDARIAELTAKVAEVEAEANKSPLRVSAGFCFLAALGLAVVGQYLRAGVCVALGGILLGLSAVLSTPLFIWSLIGSIIACLLFGLWVVWDKARDMVNASEPKDKNEPPSEIG
jgi:hypothetical protein